jgi:hypothetical protein
LRSPQRHYDRVKSGIENELGSDIDSMRIVAGHGDGHQIAGPVSLFGKVGVAHRVEGHARL